MPTDTFMFDKPSRQSSVAVVIILIKFLRMSIRSFWPVLLSIFIGGRAVSSFDDFVSLAVIGFTAFNLVGSVLTYFRFYFHIEGHEMVIDKGVLKRTKINVPFSRIQTVNFKQNILHWLFNVVSVQIDTAGAKKSEIDIDALSKKEAEALRDHILAEKKQHALVEILENDTSDGQESLTEQVLLHLSPKDLLKVGVSQNHLRSMAILFAFVMTTLNQVLENAQWLIQDQVDNYDDYVADHWLYVFLFSVVIVSIISFLFSLVNAVLKYYDLKLFMDQSGLKLVRGLLNREEISVQKKKVQIVSWSTNPIRSLFRMFTMQVYQASSSQAREKSSIKIPGSYQKQVDRVVSTVLSKKYFQLGHRYQVSKLLQNRIILFLGVFPALAGIVLYILGVLHTFYFLWVLPVTWLLARLYYKKRSFELNEELIKSNKGIFGRISEITQLHKIQAVRLKQSLYQQRKKLASLILYTAAGNITIPFIPLATAQQMEDFILYRIASDPREWM